MKLFDFNDSRDQLIDKLNKLAALAYNNSNLKAGNGLTMKTSAGGNVLGVKQGARKAPTPVTSEGVITPRKGLQIENLDPANPSIVYFDYADEDVNQADLVASWTRQDDKFAIDVKCVVHNVYDTETYIFTEYYVIKKYDTTGKLFYISEVKSRPVFTAAPCGLNPL